MRALEPLNFKERASGPGLLTRALKIDKSLHGKEFGNEVWLEYKKENKEELEIERSFRIGVKKDLKRKLRFYVKGNCFVSR